jgi:hypothetical protein
MGLLITGLLLGILGAIMAISAATMHKPSIPSGTPPELMSMQILDDPGGLSSDGILAYQNEPYTFDVSFDEKDVEDVQPGASPFLKSLGGDWYGDEAHLSVDGHNRGSAEPANTGQDWSGHNWDAESVISPSMHASLPVYRSDVGRSIRVTAEMGVHLPVSAGQLIYQVADGTVMKSATFLVVSPAQMALRKSLDAWNDRSSLLQGGLTLLGIGIVLVIWGLVRRRKGTKTLAPTRTP